MNDYELFGRYYQRAEKHITSQLIIDIVIAFIILFYTENLFYAFIYACFGYNKMRLFNTKNRQFEILKRLDDIEELLKDK